MSYGTGTAWIKIANKVAADFSTGALTNTIASGYLLPAKAIILGAQIVVNTAFSGVAIISYVISIGAGANNVKYSAAVNTFVTTLAAPQVLPGIESMSTATAITLTATAVGANLSAATTGNVDVYLLVSQLP